MVRGANFYLIGDQLQEKIRNWLQQPDPSTNYNVAIRQRHDGTAAWFTKGSTFKEWKTTGSLLWVHGKRTHFSDLHFPAPPDDRLSHGFSAGSGKSVMW